MRSFAVWKAFGLLAATALAPVLSAGCSGSDDDPAAPGAAGSAGAPSGSVSWCQVESVLAAKCQLCHVGAGLNGAPFALVTFDDTQVLNETTGKRRWEMMELMVDGDLMPPEDPRLDPPPEKLTSREKATLMTWFEEGAKAVGGTSCP